MFSREKELINSTIDVDTREIEYKKPPIIIAELSGNHNRSLERALAIVDAAAKAGAAAVKLQPYTADTMTLNSMKEDFTINDNNSLWHGKTLYNLYQEAHTPWEWHKPIFDRCRELGLLCFSTPFDETAVDLLEELNAPCYKIASFENNHIPLLRKVAKTGKPLIISTGMASVAELDLAVQTVREAGCQELVLLKCTSTYPAEPSETNLLTIPHMQELFQCQVGLSDHTLGIGVALASIALGAKVIEKHFTLSRADGGVDAPFSLEPDEMRTLVEESRRAWQALGRVSYGPTEKEKSSLIFRRSIYIAENMKAGDVFTRENIRVIRPGYGLPPKYFNLFLGKKVKADVEKGTPLTWDIVL